MGLKELENVIDTLREVIAGKYHTGMIKATLTEPIELVFTTEFGKVDIVYEYYRFQFARTAISRLGWFYITAKIKAKISRETICIAGLDCGHGTVWTDNCAIGDEIFCWRCQWGVLEMRDKLLGVIQP